MGRTHPLPWLGIDEGTARRLDSEQASEIVQVNTLMHCADNWKLTFTTQEVATAQHVTLMAGSDEMDWKTVSSGTRNG